MGYPMTYARLISRNRLEGDYDPAASGAEDTRTSIAGDLRRLEEHTVDDLHAHMYAGVAGVTVDQARTLLSTFFAGDVADRFKDQYGYDRYGALVEMHGERSDDGK